MLRSRLSKRIEQKTKKNLILSIFGIIIVIFITLKFGIPFLANLSILLSGSQNSPDNDVQNLSFIAPPILDSFPEATASADVVFTGLASKNQTINLYINGNFSDTTKAEDNGKFTFKETLSPGENTIKAKVVLNSKESEFSNIVTTTFRSAVPSLNIHSPSDNQSFSKDQNSADIRGSTDSDVKVTVNGFWAITDSNGNFSYSLPLQNGENKIKIIATDPAGNKKETELKVTYSP